jgi:hypothetical protein
VHLTREAAETALAALLATWLGEDPEPWPLRRRMVIAPWQEPPGLWSAATPEWARTQ